MPVTEAREILAVVAARLADAGIDTSPVSYTHLTLPTIFRV